WERVTGDLRRTLAGEVSMEALFAERRPPPAAVSGPVSVAPARVTVDNSVSDRRTVVEVRAPDRVGLLYRVTRALAQAGGDIVTAKIATDLDQAFAVFYVTDRAGRKVEAPASVAALRKAVTAALDAADALDARSV